jgi:hypothetical protein
MENEQNESLGGQFMPWLFQQHFQHTVPNTS